MNVSAVTPRDIAVPQLPVASQIVSADCFERFQSMVQNRPVDGVAIVQLHQGIVTGAFIVDLPRLATLLARLAAQLLDECGVIVRDTTKQMCQAASTGVVDGVCAATASAQQMATQAARSSVNRVWDLSTWPLRKTVALLAPPAPPR